MSFFQFLDYEIEREDITDPNVQNWDYLNDIKVSKLRCTVTVCGDSDNGGFGWEEPISLSDVEDMIETAREKGVRNYARALGYNPWNYPHPSNERIQFEISDAKHTYYLCVIGR